MPNTIRIRRPARTGNVAALLTKPKPLTAKQQRIMQEREAFTMKLMRVSVSSTGEIAPWGKHWVRSAMNGAEVLEAVDTPWTCSVQSETYWCS